MCKRKEVDDLMKKVEFVKLKNSSSLLYIYSSDSSIEICNCREREERERYEKCVLSLMKSFGVVRSDTVS